MSSLIHDTLHYAKRVDLNHAPQLTQPKATIDFDIDAATLVSRHTLLSKGLCIPGYGPMLQSVVDGGVFFRSPSNRREKNYWLPTLNAGLPFTPKRDAVHEATYMAHDIGHVAINPDLIFTGTAFANSHVARRLYVAHRMMSEALTMMVADVLFVEGLRKIHGMQYDWSQRRIHPLLPLAEATTGKQLLSQQRGAGGRWQVDGSLLRSLMHANVAFCLRGDEAPWRSLLGRGPTSDAVWLAFKRKYAPFMVADYEWTARNYDCMRGDADAVRRWWSSSSRLRELDPGIAITSVDEYAVQLGIRTDTSPSDIVDAVLEEVWGNTILPVMVTQPPPVAVGADPASGVATVPQSRRLFRALLRYALGQFALFARFPHHRMAGPTQAALEWSLRQWSDDAARGTFGADHIRLFRSVYGSFVSSLVSELCITPDDGGVMREVYPVFDPFFVTYDADPDAYEALPAVYRRLL